MPPSARHRSGQAAYGYRPTWQAFMRDEAARVLRDVMSIGSASIRLNGGVAGASG
jgi:hypothetical protein